MSVLSLSYYESDVTMANIYQSWPHIIAKKQLAWYEEITSLSPYVYRFFMVALWNRADQYISSCCGLLWSPYGIGRPYIFSSCFFFFLSSFFSSPNLSSRLLDVCHTSTHGVALVRI